jgi:hypothetical protein
MRQEWCSVSQYAAAESINSGGEAASTSCVHLTRSHTTNAQHNNKPHAARCWYTHPHSTTTRHRLAVVSSLHQPSRAIHTNHSIPHTQQQVPRSPPLLAPLHDPHSSPPQSWYVARGQPSKRPREPPPPIPIPSNPQLVQPLRGHTSWCPNWLWTKATWLYTREPHTVSLCRGASVHARSMQPRNVP